MKKNEQKIPRYHLLDGKHPRVVDIYKEYPNKRLKFIFENGYVYVGCQNGKKLFMSMHCASDNIEEVEEYMEELKKIRSEVYLKKFLD